MSRPIPGKRRCVVSSGERVEPTPADCRIDLVPSVRAATLAAAWLLLVCGVLLGAVALALPARIAICIAIATAGWAAVRGCLLLEGRRAVHVLDWSCGWRARIGPARSETPVTILGGSFRLGRAFLFLWLRSCDGIHAVFIDGGRQETRAFRRLCRHLRWPAAPS
jgi:hypothetical protein